MVCQPMFPFQILASEFGRRLSVLLHTNDARMHIPGSASDAKVPVKMLYDI